MWGTSRNVEGLKHHVLESCSIGCRGIGSATEPSDRCNLLLIHIIIRDVRSSFSTLIDLSSPSIVFRSLKDYSSSANGSSLIDICYWSLHLFLRWGYFLFRARLTVRRYRTRFMSSIRCPAVYSIKIGYSVRTEIGGNFNARTDRPLATLELVPRSAWSHQRFSER